jgi:hypothetical protein
MKFTIFSCRSRHEITHLVTGFAPCLLSAVDTSTQENTCTYGDEMNKSRYYTLINTMICANDFILLVIIMTIKSRCYKLGVWLRWGKTKTAQAGKHLGKCPLERSR